MGGKDQKRRVFEALVAQTLRERVARQKTFKVIGQHYYDVDRHLEITQCVITSGLPCENSLDEVNKLIAWCQARLAAYTNAGVEATRRSNTKDSDQAKALFPRPGRQPLSVG